MEVASFSVGAVTIWVRVVEGMVERISFWELQGAPPVSDIWKKVEDFFEHFIRHRSFHGIPFLLFSPLQERLKFYLMLQEIPPGETETYASVAEKFWGSRKYARVAGRWLASNRWPILFPCHRVIKSDGSPGGFTGGIEIKRLLLSWEKGGEK